jgi:hypothetical protein
MNFSFGNMKEQYCYCSKISFMKNHFKRLYTSIIVSNKVDWADGEEKRGPEKIFIPTNFPP